MVHTSYYGVLRKLDTSKYYLIPISNSNPVGLNLRTFNLLVPDWKLVKDHKNAIISDEEFKNSYLTQLESNKTDILNKVNKLFILDKDVILLCYETPSDFCHRHIFREWYNNLLESGKITELN